MFRLAAHPIPGCCCGLAAAVYGSPRWRLLWRPSLGAGVVGSRAQFQCGSWRSPCSPTVWTGRALQAESSEWERLVLLFCIRPVRGADRSWPSWISARIRSHSRIGPRRPVGSPDHGCDGETVFRHACNLGLEGIVSKRKNSAYHSGRSPDWLKMKNADAPAVKREAEEEWEKERWR